MANGVQIKGLGKVLKRFEQFAEEIKVEAQQELVASCMIEIETVAKEKLTQDGHIDTGRLRSSIFTKTKDNRTNRYSDQEGNSYTCELSKSVKELQVVCGTNVEYALKIERLDSYMLYAYRQGAPKVLKNMNKMLERLCSRYG
jgi:hypothetical protein